jgi:hypothetical protein
MTYYSTARLMWAMHLAQTARHTRSSKPATNTLRTPAKSHETESLSSSVNLALRLFTQPEKT